MLPLQIDVEKYPLFGRLIDIYGRFYMRDNQQICVMFWSFILALVNISLIIFASVLILGGPIMTTLYLIATPYELWDPRTDVWWSAIAFVECLTVAVFTFAFLFQYAKDAYYTYRYLQPRIEKVPHPAIEMFKAWKNKYCIKVDIKNRRYYG